MKGKKDPVTPALRLAVLRRDDGCVAPRLGGSFLDCFGELRLDHIKREPRMGLRAESTLGTLVTLCDGHSEAGMRGGHQWNTAHRPELREYLEKVTA